MFFSFYRLSCWNCCKEAGVLSFGSAGGYTGPVVAAWTALSMVWPLGRARMPDFGPKRKETNSIALCVP